MKQLTGLDASFLYMETDTTFAHVSTVYVYETPAKNFDPAAAVRAKYESLIGELEPLRRRLVEVPFGMDHPYWISDPNFDLDYHVRALSLAAPGTKEQLGDQIARIVGRSMDRTRPLWETYVMTGLEDGSWALLTKMHHATIDGAAGQLVLQAMTDLTPDAPAPLPGASWESEPIPAEADLVARAASNMMLNPYRAMETNARLAQGIAERSGWPKPAALPVTPATVSAPGADPHQPPPTGPAPPTPWNKTISGHRRFAFAEASLENIKSLKNATGTTVNDIVLAICAGALREYLLLHDALPPEPLRAMVPVSIRTSKENDPWTNRVSSIFATLPTDCADPLERIARCHATMLEAKRQHELVPADVLVDLNQFSSPVLAAAGSRLASQLRLADHTQPMSNLVISNVPGARQPLYLRGARLRHQFPVSIVTDGLGLNITVVSYLDTFDFGFLVDRDLVPDVWDLANLHLAEITRLFEATGAEWAVPPPAPRTKGKKSTKAKTKKADAKKKAKGQKKPKRAGKTAR